jgi:hypothetical protein
MKLTRREFLMMTGAASLVALTPAGAAANFPSYTEDELEGEFGFYIKIGDCVVPKTLELTMRLDTESVVTYGNQLPDYFREKFFEFQCSFNEKVYDQIRSYFEKKKLVRCDFGATEMLIGFDAYVSEMEVHTFGHLAEYSKSGLVLSVGLRGIRNEELAYHG